MKFLHDGADVGEAARGAVGSGGQLSHHDMSEVGVQAVQPLGQFGRLPLRLLVLGDMQVEKMLEALDANAAWLFPCHLACHALVF